MWNNGQVEGGGHMSRKLLMVVRPYNMSSAVVITAQGKKKNQSVLTCINYTNLSSPDFELQD